MDTTTVAIIAGSTLGAAFIGIVVTCIVFLTKRMKKRTNTRSKLVTSEGEVHDKKWASKYKKQPGPPDNKRTYFGHVGPTEHVMVKEKRRRFRNSEGPDYYRPSSPQFTRKHDILPPPIVVAPLDPPLQPPPPPLQAPPQRLRRIYRSLPKQKKPQEQEFRRRSSFSTERPGFFMYGLAQQYPNSNMAKSAAYAKWIPPNNNTHGQAVTVPLSTDDVKVPGVEEQERVFVVDDAMTEKTFNPRWQGEGQATATVQGQGQSYGISRGMENDYDFAITHKANDVSAEVESKEVPRIVTQVI